MESLTIAGSGQEPVRAALWAPKAGAEPERAGRAIVLVHEVFGLDAFTHGIGERLAAEGYWALAPDLYSREGLPGPASSPEDPAPAWELDAIRAAAASLPDRRCTGDIEGALDELLRRGADPEALAVLGFCRGGTLAFLAGCQSRRLSAVVSYYGRIRYPELGPGQPVQPLEMALNLEAPFLGHFAGDDPSIPASDVLQLQEKLGAFAKTFEVFEYEGASHGFANPLRPSSHPEHAARAWERTMTFLDEVL